VPGDRQEFPLKTSRLAAPFIRPLAWGPLVASIDDVALEVSMGMLGSARIPLEKIARIGAMRWPWWAGVGVRLGKNMVAFVPSSGRAALVGLTEPVPVRAPMRWHTARIAIAARDVDGLIAAVAARRSGLPRVDEEG
jgi:hypothetical protein